MEFLIHSETLIRFKIITKVINYLLNVIVMIDQRIGETFSICKKKQNYLITIENIETKFISFFISANTCK